MTDTTAVDPAVEELLARQPVPSPKDEAGAAEIEARGAASQKVQFQRLKDEARALFGMVDGVPGVKSPAEWAKLLERAGDELGNGRFIVRCLGAERYLDALTVAVLITLRQGLMAERDKLTTADIMRIDAAVVAYYNMLRAQKWIGDLALVVEGQLFGQAPLNEYHGEEVGKRLTDMLNRLAEVILPIQERAARMMDRALAALSNG